MKLIWKEHKRTCERVEQAGSAVDALMEDLRELSVETEGQTRWWLKLQEQQKLIAEYMDVVSLCRMDAAMTGRAERREWQKALKNLESVALNKWPHYSSANKFKGLKWCQLRRIMLQGFQLEKVVHTGASVPRENHFVALLMLGNSNIATLMAKTGSIPGGVDAKDEVGSTPLIYASGYGLKEVVAALIEAEANINVEGNEGVTPLCVASHEGHLEVVKELLRGGAAVNQARKDGASPLHMASQEGHEEVVKELLKAGADPTLAADNGATALKGARHFGHTRIVQLLRDHGATA